MICKFRIQPKSFIVIYYVLAVDWPHESILRLAFGAKECFQEMRPKKYFIKQNTIFGSLVKIKEASFCRSGKRKKSSQLI